jgi:short-subunit dehydrogenase
MPSYFRSGAGLASLLPLLPLAPLAPLALLALAAMTLASCAGPGPLTTRDREEKISGLVFVITGASSGLGRGVAEKLGSYGASVVLAARRTEVLEEVAARVRAAGGQALVVTTDVSQPDQVARLAGEALERFGRIDVWINNAAVASLGRFEDVPIEDHARIVDVNLKGVIFGSHAALKQFKAQGHGVLVNLGSVESRIPMPYHASYAATKHAILGLDNALRQELRLAGERNIQVTTIMPWALDTPYWVHTGNYTGHSPRMATMEGPERVVDAIIHASIAPRREVAVGFKANAALLGHQMAPALTERFSADVVHRSQMKDAPPAPGGSGAVHRPMPEGTGVEGGVRERMRREDAGQASGEAVPAAP